MTARSASPGPVDEGAARDAARRAAVVTDASALGLIAFEGPDAADFLQGQLSNDVRALRPGAGQWTSYNSPKGRMLATLFLWCAPEGTGGPRYLALVAADLVGPVAKRLAMFVLRAKLSVADATASHHFFGVGGPAAASAVRAALGDAPAAGGVLTIRDTTIVHWPDGRLVVVAPAVTAADTFAALGRVAPKGDGSMWEWLAVRAGVPMIGAATQDRFVAQTANWDAIGGLDFRKGCYPGQEIVARTQHLGRLKERL
ncbi:MAG: YgfZ/GcvT domain-containing protein, partial [Sphingomicrobium sp.]